eukprot:gene4971-6954_t
MRLITHNMLKCNIKGLKEEDGYPLQIAAEKIDIIQAEFNPAIVRKMLERISWVALKSGYANIVGLISSSDLSAIDIDKIESVTEDNLSNEDFLRLIHHIMFEIHVQDGFLICPTTGRQFPVKDGIPNMLLHEDEV